MQLCLLLSLLPVGLSIRCETAAWPPDADAKVKERIVNLDLPPEERWTEIMNEHKDRYLDLVRRTKLHLMTVFHLPESLVPTFERLVVEKLDGSLPPQYVQEIRGIAKAVDIHESYVILTNIMYDCIAMCTAAMQYDDATGSVMHLRNLDFGAMFGWDAAAKRWVIQEYLQGLLMSVDFQRKGKTQFRSVSYAGSVGVLTGLRPGAFAISVNARFSLDGGFLGLMEWFSGTDMDQYFVSFLVRDVLDDPKATYEKAVNLLSTRHLLAPVYYAVSGIKKSEACVIARARKRLVDRWDMDSESSDIHQSLLVQTNYDRRAPQPIFDDRVDPVYTCAEKNLTRDVIATLYNGLSTYPTADSMTIHTTVMSAKKDLFVSYRRNFTM